jgi:hypothetical protein
MERYQMTKLESFFIDEVKPKEEIKTEKSIYYVYVYCDSRKPGKFQYKDLDYVFDYEPFYVGKGKGSRIYNHVSEADFWFNHISNGKTIDKECNKQKIYKILKVYDDGHFPIIKIKENLTNEDSKKFEILCITNIGRLDLKTGPLTNLTNGGDGNSGQVVSDETKKKISDNHADVSGKNNPIYGKPRSKETKDKISNMHKGKPAWNKGKKTGPMSEESKLKMSISRRGRSSWNAGKSGYHIHTEENKKALGNRTRGDNNFSNKYTYFLSDDSKYWELPNNIRNSILVKFRKLKIDTIIYENIIITRKLKDAK